MKKRMMAITALSVGAIVLVVSAMADVIAGSGYWMLKNSAKVTSHSLANEVDNFALEASFSFTNNGEVVQEQVCKQKFDGVNGISERLEKSFSISGGETEYYNYHDEFKSIYSNAFGQYTVATKKVPQKPRNIYEDPFKEDAAEDVERIVDAFVGNLQNLIEVTETDGKKMFSGSLNQAQVPALINAITSFVLKQSTASEYSRKASGLPKFASDIYINEVFGKAIENQQGLLESVFMSGSLTGTDDMGAEHLLGITIYIDLKDINSTVITEPDLSGKEVAYTEDNNGGFNELPNRYGGVYKSDITKLDNDKYVKIGEMVLELGVENNVGSAHLYANYFTDAPENVIDVQFDLVSSEFRGYSFQYVGDDGETKNGVLNIGDGRPYGVPEANIQLGVEYQDRNSYSSQEYIRLHYSFD